MPGRGVLRAVYETACYYVALCYDDDCTVFERALLTALYTAASIALLAALWLDRLQGPVALIALLVLVLILSRLSTTAVCALFRRSRVLSPRA